MKWDTYFMSLCYMIALQSKDESTKYGAIIVGPEKEIRSTGYNSFPRGINDNIPERQIRPEKYLWFEHAERNAIYNAARVGTPTEDTWLYVQGIPCMDCARAIVQAGIKRVIVHKQWMDRLQGEIWIEHSKRTIQLFNEAGVVLEKYDGPVQTPYAFLEGKKIDI